MKRKVRVTGYLKDAPQYKVILGYCEHMSQAEKIVEEYSEVFGDEIEFDFKVVKMLTYEQGRALEALFAGLLPPMVRGYKTHFLTE